MVGLSSTLRGSLQIGDGFLESTLLRVGQTLKGEGERVIGFQFQSLSSQLDRFVVAPREDQEHAPERVGPHRQRIESRLLAGPRRALSSCRAWLARYAA